MEGGRRGGLPGKSTPLERNGRHETVERSGISVSDWGVGGGGTEWKRSEEIVKCRGLSPD